ncbi:uncharacterized protein KD926_008086 [Aspergillus affinis]|uniref:uncharacterized protein n=1 Tax=Aspergillus affinis TaxID=1070780 RepID=UPI0022FDE9A9|nr:uncharacterized protein KD926_008086 [Aspergillus affinis]KAI9045668.1 hypothetical protein KD926_008086 [Aspergillus affinis]
MDKAQALLPNEERLHLISGLDLSTADTGAVAAFLKSIPQAELLDLACIFAAYSVKDCLDLQDIKRLNTRLLSNLLDAVDICCPRLQFITLQTGGKYYGVQFPNEVNLVTPFKESVSRIPEPFANDIFYYAQIDLMNERNKGKSWKWADIRPDAIVGFVPQNNALGIAQALAVFLSLYRYVHGDGAKVPFPGDSASFKAKHTDTSQEILARFTIFVNLGPEKRNGRAYNIGNSDKYVSWETKWSGICEYFGLKGEPPLHEHPLSVSRWIQEHHTQCSRWVKEFKLKQGAFEGSSWEFLEALVSGAFRNTASAALGVELYLPPMRIQMQQTIQETAIRIQTGPAMACPRGLRWERSKEAFKASGYSPMEALKWKKTGPLYAYGGRQEEWETRRAHVLAPWELPLRYIIEGAEEAGMIGAAAVSIRASRTARKYLGTELDSTVYVGELEGARMALDRAKPTPITVFSDSQAAIQAVRNPGRPSGQYALRTIYGRIRALRSESLEDTELR